MNIQTKQFCKISIAFGSILFVDHLDMKWFLHKPKMFYIFGLCKNHSLSFIILSDPYFYFLFFTPNLISLKRSERSPLLKLEFCVES